MWFIEKIITLLLFPVHWFWEKFEEYKDEQCIWKIILLFIVSLSGVILLGICLIWITVYIFSNHPEWVVVVGVIIWLYAYIKSKMGTLAPTPVVDTNLQQIQEQADKGYPIIRNILYQALKEIAPSIGCNPPRVLQEIELQDSRYIINSNICFYQFKIPKADIRFSYAPEDLLEFKRIIQSDISLKIQSGAFPSIQIEKYRDKYGTWHDSIIIDTVEDMDNILIIQAVFVSAEYADFIHWKQHNQANNVSGGIPPETWK